MTIRAAFKENDRAFIREIERPPLGPDQLRLRVEACGVCGTDLHPQQTAAAEPFGHEIVGRILEVGPAVLTLKPGDRVALDSSTPCGCCAACRNAQQELCTQVQSFWPLGSFGFAEEMVAPAICAIPVEGLDPAVACLQEPLGVAIDMVRLAEIDPTSNVLLIGPGPIGLMALAIARRQGARRILVAGRGRRPVRQELALKFGADAYINVDETPLEQYSFADPIDRILVTAPPRTLPAAFTIAAKGAILSFIGIEQGAGAFCTFDVNAFHFKKLQLRASFASPAQFGPLALQYLREKVVDGDALISHRYGLADIQTALDTARSDPTALKVVIEP